MRSTKTIEEKIDVMLHYNSGGKICFTDIYNVQRVVDKTNFTPLWDWANFDYSIYKEDEYRPYESTKEFVYDYCKKTDIIPDSYALPIIWVKSKLTNAMYVVSSIQDESIMFTVDSSISLKILFEQYTFLDGSACGIKL